MSKVRRHIFLKGHSTHSFLIAGVLETSSDEFESSDEVFEAVGGILQEVDASKEEDQIRDLCEQVRASLSVNQRTCMYCKIFLPTR